MSPLPFADELVRVCRRGGWFQLVTWTPEGEMGELLSIVARHLRRPPDFASPPVLWGSEEHVRDLLGEAVELTFTRGLKPWRFASPDAYVTFMQTHYGPLVRARERLEDRRWEHCRAEILAMVERRNEASDGSLRLYAEYLVIVGQARVRRISAPARAAPPVRLRPATAGPAARTSPRPGARPGR